MDLYLFSALPLLLSVGVAAIVIAYTTIRIANLKDLLQLEMKKTRAELARFESSLRAEIERASKRKD